MMSRRVLKWALLGGIAGGAVVALRSLQRNDDVEELTAQSARAGAAGAVLGVLGAVVVGRRARKHRSLTSRTCSVLHLGGRLDKLPVDKLRLDKLPVDKLHLERLHLDDQRARLDKQVDRLGQVAAPKLHSALDLLVEAADLARPMVEAAAARGTEVASSTADAASSRVRSVRNR